MKKSRKIAFSAVVAISYVVAIMGVTQLNSINTDILGYKALASFPIKEGPVVSDPKTVTALSRTIIERVYGEAVSDSKVLGDVTPPAVLSQEQISDISNPAVVRVFNATSGTITIPEFTIDFSTLDIVPLQETYTEKIDDLSTGTGFLVDDNGHILTNAHVVDKNSALDTFTAQVVVYYAGVLLGTISSMPPEQLDALEASLQSKYGGDGDEAAELLAEDMLKYITEFVKTNAQADLTQKVTVLDPSATNGIVKTLSDLKKVASSSLSAEVVDTSEDYKDTQKDVALIKINETNTPSLLLNGDVPVNVGHKIFVVGYPANATVDRSDLYTTTLTTGSINSIKDINGVKVYQTDAKISPGSSGGPVLNENGQVIGMMTFLTSGDIGDSFAFAIPSKFGADVLTKNNISNEDAKFANSFLNGMSLKSEQLCRKANEKFSEIKNMNGLFTEKINVQKYVEECNSLIASGQSKDGTWETIKSSVSKVPVYGWAGGAAILAIAIGAIYFVRKTKRHEDTIIPMSTLSSNTV